MNNAFDANQQTVNVLSKIVQNEYFLFIHECYAWNTTTCALELCAPTSNLFERLVSFASTPVTSFSASCSRGRARREPFVLSQIFVRYSVAKRV